jgi:hypothetical protein
MNVLPTKLNRSINYSRWNYFSIAWDGKFLPVDRNERKYSEAHS